MCLLGLNLKITRGHVLTKGGLSVKALKNSVLFFIHGLFLKRPKYRQWPCLYYVKTGAFLFYLMDCAIILLSLSASSALLLSLCKELVSD